MDKRGGIPLGTVFEQNGGIFGIEGLDGLQNACSIFGICGTEDGVNGLCDRFVRL